MASAQVLSKPAASSRKKKDLEAGRRLLEEFRKKKGVAKKESPTNQPRSDDATPNEKQISDNGPMLSVNSGNGSSVIVTRTSAFSDLNDKTHVSIQHNGPDSAPQAHLGTRNNDHSSPDTHQTLPKQVQNSYMSPASNFQPGSDFSQQTDYSVGDIGAAKVDGRYADAMSSDRPSVSQVYGNSDSHSKWYGSDKDFSSSGSFPSTYATANDVAAKFHIEGRVSNVLNQQSDSLYSSTDLRNSASDFGHGHLDLKNNYFGLEDRKPSNAVGNSMGFGSPQASEPRTIDFNSNSGGLFNGPSYSAVADPFPKRSRPSFLDSIVKDSSVSGRPFVERDNPTSSKFSSSNVVTSSAIHNPSTVSSTSVEPLLTPVYSTPSDDLSSNASKGHKSFEHDPESRLEFSSQKQNEDFAALEQHIEDLTQEKFSLQRTLEASKSLTESLAAENSSLTESYNQQASIVNQLKDEMERLQDEIKTRLVELEAIKAEYMNAQLECNAADERAKLLASEVISLEEKALRLRSNELKLERELENSNAEIASYKKKMSSLDKERRDLLQTIDALQEEKKLMQSKLRRASTSGISIDLNNGHTKTDASTSTTDLEFDASGNSSEQASSNMQMLDNVDNFQLLQNNFAGHEDFSMSIPPDQVQMIQNINSLIAEILSEKDELMQALITEVSKSTKLKESNKELSQKLEVQTQRLELLTSQSMASEHVATKQPASSHIVQESVTYADEGDEVVERVLGWIMKLFPGGPSKRRSSRL